MRLDDLREARNQRRRYDGPPLETGNTSTNFRGMGDAMNKLVKTFPEGGKIIDYGAGAYSRIANPLRKLGFNVYEYDPFNGSPDNDGWSGGASTKLPRGKFDVGFTSMVLNVVPEYIEKDIIEGLNKRARTSYHITRNRDFWESVHNALLRQDPAVSEFFLKEFANRREAREFKQGIVTPETLELYCEHGSLTIRGFQRTPTAEDYGVPLIRMTDGFKVYQV